MKRYLLFLLIIPQFIFFSCHDGIVSPINNLQISDHILTGSFVTSIAFDSKGTAWVGTFYNELIKYDGSETHYNAQNSSLPDSFLIWDIAIDKNDNVWIGSNKGLIKYDNKKFYLYNKTNAPLVTDNVFALAVDKDNTLWFTSSVYNEGGLMKYDGTTWTLYTPQNSQLPNSLINDILVDEQNNKWIAVSKGLNNCCIVKLNNDNWTTYGAEEMGFEVYMLWKLTNYNDNIYASIDYGLSSSWNINRPNIITYNGKLWQINNPVNEKRESLGYVGEIAVDLNGNLWAETSENGIAVYNGNKWFYDKSKLLFENSVFDIVVDSKNAVWIGTADGIYIIKQSSRTR